MCPSIVLLGDIGTDHDGFHPSPVIAASPDVFLDNKPVARQGDALEPHDKPNNPPPSTQYCRRGGFSVGEWPANSGHR